MDRINLFQTDRNWLEIKDAVLDIVDRQHLQGVAQGGGFVKQLEDRLALQFKRRYCVSFGNCTDALTAAVISLGLPANSRIGVSDYTFIASAHAIARAGHQVVPLDVNDEYCVKSCEDVDAVVAVDLFGNMTDISEFDVPVIMDAAQSLESHNGERWSAQGGLISCISFSPSKTVSSWGSGGAALTDDHDTYQKLLRLRLHGKSGNEISIHPGMNSMLSVFEAACIWAGLDRMPQWHERRSEISQFLIDESKYKSAMDLSLKSNTISKLVFQSNSRDKVRVEFSVREIDTAVHYDRLIHEEKLYSSHICENSKRLSSISFTVPNQHTLTDEEVERIAEALR